MRTKYNKRRFRTVIMIFILLLCMSIGYSYLLTTLNIEGTSNIKANTWDVHWENVSVKSGSVTGDQVPIDAYVMSDTTQVEYSVILKNPGDYYEFTVDAKNSGSLDAMVSITDTKFYESNGVTQINLPNYLEYEFLYSNGVRIEPNQLLAANSSRTIKVKIKFKDDLDESELPTTDKTIVIRQSITYIQADENAVAAPNSRFEQDSWDDINDNILDGHGDYYNIGDTKTVDMDSFGTHTVRLVNKSIPSECFDADFSKTACGYVVEFEDIIITQKMNQTDYTNGGWPVCIVRTYLSNDIYNALPETLRNVIIDTTVVSGHGLNDSSNFTSTDKLYLLSTHEVWEDVDGDTSSGIDYYDTAYHNTRQLDYYNQKGVTISNYADTVKNGENPLSYWWLRSTTWRRSDHFDVNINGSMNAYYAVVPYGVSPAFRIGLNPKY